MRRRRRPSTALVASTPDRGWRQLAVVDAAGGAATFSGERVEPPSPSCAATAVAVIGNVLAVDRCRPGDAGGVRGRATASRWPSGCCGRSRPASRPAASCRRFARPRCWSSAAQPFPLVDLRVDLDDRPVGAAAELWERLPAAGRTSSSPARSTPTSDAPSCRRRAVSRRRASATSRARCAGSITPGSRSPTAPGCRPGSGCRTTPSTTRCRPCSSTCPYRKGDTTAVDDAVRHPYVAGHGYAARASRHSRQRRLRGAARRRVQPAGARRRARGAALDRRAAVVHGDDRDDGHLLGRVQQPAGGGAAAARAEGDHHRLLDRRPLRRRRPLHRRLGARVLPVGRGHR